MSAIMSSRLAAELDHAFEREGWTASEVKALTGRGVLGRLRKVWLDTHPYCTVENSTPEAIDSLREFFTIRRPGLYVWSDFQDLVLTPSLVMSEVGPVTIGTAPNLPKDKVDIEIRKELGESNVFENALVLCFYLKYALERQWGGTEGKFLTNSGVNAFGVRVGREVFAVHVYWIADQLRWYVKAYCFEERRWLSSYRTFP